MIDAKELRIGNLIKYGKQIVTIVTLWDDGIFHFEDVDKDTYSSETEKVKPIPLTPEILERCGFENLKYIGEFNYRKNYIDIQIGEGKVSLNILVGPTELDLQVDIKYLHQLQNLYFALTGEELNITL